MLGTNIKYLGSKDCKFTLKGQNLAEMRRAKLQKLAKALKVDPVGSKQEILKRVIGALSSRNAPAELADL